jgi:hypothetical protein
MRLRSYRDPGWWGGSRHQGGDELAEEGPAPAPCVVHELEEDEVERQLLLRDAAMGPQPRAQQRPEALSRVDVDLAEAVAIVVAGILAAPMTLSATSPASLGASTAASSSTP